ncbi:MAG: hypothetical protein AVDCRST_MAG93-5014, partial [uncultured Chloroflexia bacterium]
DAATSHHLWCTDQCKSPGRWFVGQLPCNPVCCICDVCARDSGCSRV